MAERVTDRWMWAEACAMLARSEQLHRQFFQLTRSRARLPAWEPPVDVLETADEVLVIVALPGVNLDEAETVIDQGHLVIGGHRTLPPQLRDAVIHRLELPQGRFERRVPLPPGHFGAVRRAAADGCLLIILQKIA